MCIASCPAIYVKHTTDLRKKDERHGTSVKLLHGAFGIW